MKRINDQYPGNFTDDDRAVTKIIYRTVVDDGKIRGSIEHDGVVIFKNSTWPKMFGDTAMEAYTRNTEAFTSMFENREKYDDRYDRR